MSKDVGTTSEVGQGEPVVRTGSSGEPVSFDEMEAIMERKPAPAAGDKAPPKKPEPKTPPKKKPEGKGDDTETEEEDAETSTDDVKTKGQKESSDDKAKPKTKNFKVKVKVGDEDKEIDLPANTTFEVKVGGKAEQVDLQTALNEYSGKTDWSRKYQTLDTERKSFEGERRELQSAIDTLHDLAITQKKPTDAITYLADLLGGDGVKVVKEMQAQMFKAFEELSKLTPEERRVRDAEERAAVAEGRISSQEKIRSQKAEQEAVTKRVEDIKTKHNMTDERFGEIYKTLKATVPAEELTPELIGEVHQRWLQMDDVDTIVGELKPEGDLVKVKTALLDEWKVAPDTGCRHPSYTTELRDNPARYRDPRWVSTCTKCGRSADAVRTLARRLMDQWQAAHPTL